MKQFVTWKIGGEAGFGIMSAGTMLAKALSRQGFYTIASNEYPSLIRGGNNVITVGIQTKKFHSLHRIVDILIALNKQTIDLHKHELHEGSYVVFDPKDGTPEQTDFAVSVQQIALPLTDMVKALGGDAVMRNTVALGASIALLGLDFSVLDEVIQTQFEKKGQAVIRENRVVAKAGYEAIKKSFGSLIQYYLETPEKNDEHLLMNASEAVGIGAVDGGMKFAAIYPMTPINALINLFADHEKELGITYIQPEDEIAGINMALGASLAGVRSMVATSGGGFSLMVEGLSMAGIMEVPLVIDLGMRPGPATGMPSWTEQGELLFSIFSGHGEFPRIILAPGDATESYQLTKRAFDLSQIYQIPVIILTDKYLNESVWCVSKGAFDHPSEPLSGLRIGEGSVSKDFRRYVVDTKDGVSPRSFPGMKDGLYIANSYEHDENGLTTEDAGVRKQMAEKRLQKQHTIRIGSPMPNIYGDAQAQYTFVSFGSTKGPILEAIALLKERGILTKLIHFSWVYPLNQEKVRDLLSQEKRLIVIEGNGTGQLKQLIKLETGIDIQEQWGKYDGRQWFPEEIVEQIIKSDKSDK